MAVLVAVAVRDVPPGTVLAPPQTLAEVRGNLHAAWHEPGTRLGLYTHLSTQFSATVFGLLWGFPFLTVGQGLAPGTAAGLLTLLVVSGMVFGPVIGQLCGRWPLRRSALVFGILGATASVWTLVLAWPGRAPLPLLVLLVLVLSTNGPGSMIGFDYARTENPAARLGSASGVVNVGGFLASLLLMLAIGLVLDARTPGDRGRTTRSGRSSWRSRCSTSCGPSGWSGWCATAASCGPGSRPTGSSSPRCTWRCAPG